ncbi:hypothetical protein [Ekhidna sp.]|uniref:hypothetical protein n=1 Tax=Ekhidna sp. TaxID=2608089 RepID=UPI003CCB7F11
MNTNKIIAALISIFLLTILNACDPVVDYEKAIVNSSNSEILLVRNNPIPFDDQDVSYSESILLDSVLLPANARQLLTEGFDIGGSVEAYADCPGLQEGDSIFVWVETGVNQRLALTLTQTDFAGKHRELSKNRCECVFEVTDEMLD